ncbi:M60 family peptidase N-terminal accessory domain-containing protein [Sphingobacterium lactis]|uniref:M60 family peptidase N-terminal accessory domain-containing protein n=1 Tax=Sphingobacterium lactis TaxID=797291 RepID=UPI003F7EBE45
MKRIIYSLFCAALVFQSCGKYGYDFDNTYPEGDKTGNDYNGSDKKDTRFLEKAKVFPGLVGDDVKRIADTTVQMDFRYPNPNPQVIRTNFSPKAILNTGLYAPAGEPIRITIPDGIQGMKVQIGVHTDYLIEQGALHRDDKITMTAVLLPGENLVNNPFGGTILLQADVAPIANVMAVKVKGAVRSPDFVLGKTNVATWKQDILKQDVPWVEFQGKNISFSVPRNYVLKYLNDMDPEYALNFWDEIYQKDFYQFQGFGLTTDPKDQGPKYVDRCVFDIQPLLGSHSGFPWMMQLSDDNFKDILTKSSLTAFDFKKEALRKVYSLIGQNQAQSRGWMWKTIAPSMETVYMYRTAQRLNLPLYNTDPLIVNSHKYAMEFINSTTKRDLGTLAADYPSIYHPVIFSTPIIQIMEKAVGKTGEPGWKLLSKIFSEGRLSTMNFLIAQNQIDFFYKTLSEATGKDYQRFLKEWGIYPSYFVQQEIRKNYQPLERAIWEYNPADKTKGDQPVTSKYDLNHGYFVYTTNVSTFSSNGFDKINDKNYSTFWRTCTGTCEVVTTLPVYVNLDLTRVESFKGLFYGNQGTTANMAKKIEVYTSEDQYTWKLVKTFSGLPQRGSGRIELELDEIVDAQYVRVAFPEVNSSGTTLVALSELGLFYDIKR